MYKYFFNEKTLHSRTCAFHMLHDGYYTKGKASTVKRNAYSFLYVQSVQEDSGLTFEIKQINICRDFYGKLFKYFHIKKLI